MATDNITGALVWLSFPFAYAIALSVAEKNFNFHNKRNIAFMKDSSEDMKLLLFGLGLFGNLRVLHFKDLYLVRERSGVLILS